MTPHEDTKVDSSRSVPSELPDDLVEHLSRLDESELRAVISYSKSLLPRLPTVDDLLEERPAEEILEVEEKEGYTRIVKKQPCAHGCDDCPHGPYLYHVRVEPHPEDGESASLHWEFLGQIQ